MEKLNMNSENQTLEDVKMSRLKLNQPLLILESIAIILGTILSIICIIKYVRDARFRTHYTYISTDFLIGYQLKLFYYSIDLCKVSNIHYLTINIGMVTSLAYASIERHFLVFHKNGLLTWYRQLLPVMYILLYSYIVAILFALLPLCEYLPCIACYTRAFQYMIPWLIISFFIPQSIMIIATIYLLYRLYKRRKVLHQRPQWSALKRIGIQMTIYVIWSCVCYCPVSFYNLTANIDHSLFVSESKILMDMTNTIALQTYPLLTFISMLLFTQRMQSQQKKNLSLKLIHVTTISVPSSNGKQ